MKPSSLRASARTWWYAQQFNPGGLGWLVNPFYFARLGLWRGLREFFPRLDRRVLDVGCGRQPYRPYLPATADYVGMEIDTPRTRRDFQAEVYYDGKSFPFPDGSFDAVLCSQVFEHVFTPGEFLAEINRVLRPGGLLLLTVPFVWDEHEQPHDFARYSSFGLQALLERAGFAIEGKRKTMSDSRVLFQLLNAYLFKVTGARTSAIRWRDLLVLLVLLAPVNLAGIIFGPLLPANPDLFLDNVILARKSK